MPHRMRLGGQRVAGVMAAALALALLSHRLVPTPDAAMFEQGSSAMSEAKAKFLEQAGDRYGYGNRIDALYAAELLPRWAKGQHYFDYTGSALYWNSQVAAAMAELQETALGNPHCASPSAARTEGLVGEARDMLLRFFNADPKQYTLVFTRSGTGALRMLGEMFPWTPASRFAYLTVNHNSVLGIREYARQHGAEFGAMTEEAVEDWLQQTSSPGSSSGSGIALQTGEGRAFGLKGRSIEEVQASAAVGGAAGPESPAFSLFAYPAYDNYAGVMYPLSWVEEVQARSNATHVWKVLLDAAAFTPAHKLDLSKTPADFVPLSFYKMFGYPTGIGALILRKENVPLLRKGYFGGGSAFLATATSDWHYFQKPPGSFEHGTLAFLDILALKHGLRVYERVGGVEAVERHVSAVSEYLYEQLAALRHSNGKSLVRVFGKHHLPNRHEVQGGTINFEVLGRQGGVISYKGVAARMSDAGLHVRTGCSCNPGACYNATGVRDEELQQEALRSNGNFETWEWTEVVRGDQRLRLPLGSIRASLGMMSRFEDAQALVEFIRSTYTDADDSIK